jgi:hypothetical protein
VQLGEVAALAAETNPRSGLCRSHKFPNIVARIQGAPDFARLHALLEEKLKEKI